MSTDVYSHGNGTWNLPETAQTWISSVIISRVMITVEKKISGTLLNRILYLVTKQPQMKREDLVYIVARLNNVLDLVVKYR